MGKENPEHQDDKRSKEFHTRAPSAPTVVKKTFPTCSARYSVTESGDRSATISSAASGGLH